MSAQHGTPWARDRNLIVRDAEGEWVCNVDGGNDASADRARVDFIVRACNAHDELVAALREARIFVGSMESDGAKIAMRQIESALAKAGAA